MKDFEIHSNQNTNSSQGAKQQQRLSAALKSGYIDLEERGLEEFIWQAYAYAKHIKFIDANNQPNGTWSELLANNDTVLLTLIAKYPIEARVQKMQAFLSQRSDSSVSLLVNVLKETALIINELDLWHVRLQKMKTQAGQLVNRRLFEVIQTSQSHIQLVYETHTRITKMPISTKSHAVLTELNSVEEIFNRLHRVWNIQSVEDASQSSNKRNLRQALERAFYYLINTIKQLSAFSRTKIQDSLIEKKQEPSSALLIAFLQLLTQVNNKTKGFTDKHRDFYYKDVLQIPRRVQKPDQTIVLIQPNDKSHDKMITKGTVFLASNDELKETVSYTASADMSIACASVSAVANCNLDRNSFNVPSFHLGLINHIHAQYFNPYQFMDESWQSPLLQNNAPLGKNSSLFGGYLKDGQPEIKNKTELGFAIANHHLLATQGQRHFRIELKLESREDDALNSLNVRHQEDAINIFLHSVFIEFREYIFHKKRIDFATLEQTKQTLTNKLKQQSMAYDVFQNQSQESLHALELIQAKHYLSFRNKLFSTGFKLLISTDIGWYEIANYNAQFDVSGLIHTLVLSFELNESQPAFINAESTLHSNTQADEALLKLTTGLPTIKVLLAEDAEFYLYSLLENLIVVSNSIDVEVKGLNNLMIHNDTGPVDTSSPFQPFGAQPKNDQSLIISSDEFSYKQIKKLDINVQWHQLPKVTGGFEQYYQDYQLGIKNEDFQVCSSVLINGNWHHPNVEQTQMLFSLNKANQLHEKSTLSIHHCELFQPATKTEHASIRYHSNSLSGFCKIQLSGKPTAFAHAAYPHVLNQKLVSNIKKKAKQKPLNEPYTPLVNKISVDYQAQTKINVEQLSVLNRTPNQHHIVTLNPFGAQTLAQAYQEGNGYLIPQYSNANHLYIGLDIKEQINTPISIYFDLMESSVNKPRSNLPIIEWAYLAGDNDWQLIPAKEILQDTTSGFLKSGIIRLNLPSQALQHLNSKNATHESLNPIGIMDTSQFWIRISTQESATQFCQLNGVEINALELVRDQSDAPSTSLAAGSISKTQRSLFCVKSIYQPRDSRVGRAKENEYDWVKRSSERLRHRQRAITAWDYERLVLEEFDFIDQVKCFPCLDVNTRALPVKKAPGHISLVVIPAAQQQTPEQLCTPPKMISAIELNRIQKYLQSMACDGIKINVCNPNYEYLQVRCSVVFAQQTAEANPHHALNTALIHYISSWGNYGPTRQFEWAYYEDEITAFIHDLPYIEFVTALSLLKVTHLNKDEYVRTDSVLVNKHRNIKQPIEPSYPWCIAIPTEQHVIKTLNQRTSINTLATGYDELEIGNNFILSK